VKLRVGIDVGGTFTDVSAFDEDADELVAIRKYLSHPNAPAAVMDAITQDLAHDFGTDSVSLILHGSTAALNTLLEGKGARVGLLTTAGFRDVYEIGRQWRGEDVFNIFAPPPRMLLPRDRIFEVRERLDAKGEVVEPLQSEDVSRAVRKLVAAGVDAVAVCFLFAYADPRHEKKAADIIRAIAPDLYVSLSHEVNPEWREYERTAATVANAYIGPPVSHYLRAIEGLALRRFPRARALMMKSDGGAASATMLAHTPIKTVMSGPVAGVIGARYLGDVKGIEKLITFDTGGTSSDMAVLPGAPLFKSEVAVARHPLRSHTVDIETIGAGGGSIASVQLGGVLKVGPQSAGADPGPACYGRGGTRPTVTDADLVCGYLNPDYFLGGAQTLDVAAARAALQTHIADPLKMDVLAAAAGIQRIVDMRMADEVLVFAAKRGVDLTAFTLLPFGGAGAVHAAAVAEELGMRRILVPPRPGAFSALGLLCTDVVHDHIRSELRPLAEVAPDHAEDIFRQLEAKARAEVAAEGMNPTDARCARELDLRYTGQGYELRTPLDGLFAERLTAKSLAAARDRFDERHAQIHGHAAKERPVEVVSYRLRVRVAVPKYEPRAEAAPAAPRAVAKAVKGRRSVSLDGAIIEATVYERDRLDIGATIAGPAIVEQFDATTVIPPGWSAQVDGYRNLTLQKA
jgi:N-methylhydantoinase A